MLGIQHISKKQRFKLVTATFAAGLFFMLVFVFLSKVNTKGSNVKVVLNLKIQETQDFQLYYTSGISFTQNDFINITVKSSSEFQEVVFILPKLSHLKNLRLDLGSSPTHIEIKQLTFKGNGKSHKIIGAELKNSINPINGIKSITTKNKNVLIKTEGADPFVYFNIDCHSVYQKVNLGYFPVSPTQKISITINARSHREQYVKLYFNSNHKYVALKLKQSDKFEAYEFNLPQLKDLHSLRLGLANNNHLIDIKDIEFNGWGSPHHIFEDELLHSLDPINQIASTEQKDGFVRITPNITKESELNFNFDTNIILQKVGRVWFKTNPFIYALIISILFFFGLIKSNFSGIKLKPGQVLVGLFFIIIMVPGLFLLNKTEDTTLIENRTVAEKPPFEFETIFNYSKLYDSFFNDNFGLRTEVLALNNYLKGYLLGFSPLPDKLALGKNKWLYFSFDCDPNYNNHDLFFTPDELNIFKKNLEERHRYLEKKGIKFYVFIAPTKSSVYPEFLPSKFTVSPTNKLTQLIDFLKHNTILNVIDPKMKLLKEKKSNQLFYKTDTHWNAKGAYVGYSALIRAIQKDFSSIHPIKRDEIKFIAMNSEDGDLAQLINMNKKWPMKQFLFEFNPVINTIELPETALKTRPFQAETRPIVMQSENDTLPKLLMYRDSYTISLLPLLSQNFSESTFLWTYKMTPAIIESEKPDLVVLQIVERYLEKLRPINPPGIVGQ